MVDWNGLPYDILYEIGKRVNSIESYDSFGAVSKSWRAASPRDKQHLKLKTFGTPWFMLPPNTPPPSLITPPRLRGWETLKRRLILPRLLESPPPPLPPPPLTSRELLNLPRMSPPISYMRESPVSSNIQEFFSVSSGKIRKIFLPEANKKYCLSWNDWIFMYDEDKTHVSLLHLVSRVQIHLPDMALNMGYITYIPIDRVVLSANPNSSPNFTVIVLLHNRIFIYKLGITSWTSVIPYPLPERLMIYHNNYLYTWDSGFGMVRYDVNEPNSNGFPRKMRSMIRLGIPWNSVSTYEMRSVYMLEFSDKIYFVRKYSFVDTLPESRLVEGFEVYEMDINCGENQQAEKINNLGNKAIFLSKKSLYMIECSEFNKCKPNCIYFKDDSEYGRDMGIYHLSDGSFDNLFDENTQLSKYGEPLWFGPSF